VQLAFFLPANKHPTPYEDVFRYTVPEAAKLSVNIFPKIFAEFETAIYMQRKRCGEAWKLKHIVSI
jgi:hypothetical protein